MKNRIFSLIFVLILSGCASVDYVAYDKNIKLYPKAKEEEIPIIEEANLNKYKPIGKLSITQSIEYGYWFGPSRGKAREELEKGNIIKIKKKAQAIGAEACVPVKHLEEERNSEYEHSAGAPMDDKSRVTTSLTITQTRLILCVSSESEALIKKNGNQDRF